MSKFSQYNMDLYSCCTCLGSSDYFRTFLFCFFFFNYTHMHTQQLNICMYYPYTAEGR